MKTSLTETIAIEQHLQGTHDPSEALLFEANCLLQPGLAEKIRWQKQSYALIKAYGRKQFKAELETIHQRLFTEPAHRSFREKVLALFNKG